MCQTKESLNIPIWSVYILRTAQGVLYTGISTNIERRLAEHRLGKGAKALRGKGALQLVYQQLVGSRSEALKLEFHIKQLSKMEKEHLIQQNALCKENRELLI